MEQSSSEPESSPRTKRRQKLQWIASLLLALLVMCSGCGFFFTVGLMSRGELTASVLGTNVRLWRIVGKSGTGVGLDRAFEIHQADRACMQHYTMLVLWRPSLSIDNLAYDDCS